MPPAAPYRSSPAPALRSPAGAAGHFTRRRFLQVTGFSAAALAFYAGEYARHDLEISHIPMVLRNLPDAFHNFRIVQLSDIHYEEFTEPIYLRRIIADINALAPDLVLITGDFITHGPPRIVPEHSIYTCAQELRAIQCPQRLGILGNHDCTVGAAFITRVLHDHDQPVLNNRYVPIERDGQRLWIAGVLDPSTSHPKLDLAIPPKPDGPVILMAHAPDFADDVVAHPTGHLVDYMLSGHSHGGQVRLPLVGALALPPMGRKYIMGHFQFGDTQLYVNRGVGSVGVPFRFNCRPELTVFTLQRA